MAGYGPPHNGQRASTTTSPLPTPSGPSPPAPPPGLPPAQPLQPNNPAGPRQGFDFQPFPHAQPPPFASFDPSLVPAYQLPPQQPQQNGQGQHAYNSQHQGYPHPHPHEVHYQQQASYQQQQHPHAQQQHPHHPQQHPHHLQQQQQQQQHHHQQQQHQQQQHQLSSANALLGLKRSHPSSGGSTPVHPSTGSAPGSKKARRQSGNSRAGGSSDDEDDSEDEDDEDEGDAGGDAGAAGAKKGGIIKLQVGKAGGATGAKGKAVELGPDGKKPKATRGSRACTVCRKLKMRCFSEEGPPCKRCKSTNQECIFEESNRGKKSTKKHEAMAQSLKKMEQTLNTVLQSIHNPGMAAFASGMVTRSPSPNGTQQPRQSHLLGEGQVLPGVHSIDGGAFNNPNGMQLSVGTPGSMRHPSMAYPHHHAPPHLAHYSVHGSMPHSSAASSSSNHTAPPPRAHSPRLHSLPDNSLNPLGLLAEASLHNHRRVEARGAAGMMVRNLLNDDGGPSSSSPGQDVDGEKKDGEGEVDPEAGEQAAKDAAAKCNSLLARRAVGAVGHGGSSDLRSRPPSPVDVPAGIDETGSKDKNGSAKGEEKATTSVEAAKEGQDDDAPVGLANATYFKPGPMTMLPLRRIIIERSIRPEILDFLSTEEVLELFDIYFDFINLQVPVLDRSFHTPGLVASRSPFLLTTVCWVASKFYQKRPELFGRLSTCVRKLAFETPGHGFKSVEIVQSYLILTCYGLPVERFELDQAWLLLGMGIRVATDLNLHRKSQLSGKDTDESKARDREIINRERTWLMCFILDRSLSAQMGKPYSIREDYIIRNKTTWSGSSQFGTFTDRGMVAYVGLQQIMSRALDFIYSGTSTASGLQTDLDYPLFLRSVEAQLNVWDTEWQEAWDLYYTGASEAVKTQLGHSRGIGSFYYSYALLMMNSFGLQNALERAHIELGHFFARVAGAAMDVIKVARDVLAPSGRLTYAPDSTFTMLSYAILSLLKLLRPALTVYLESPSKILETVHSAVKMLEDVAIDSHHTPALHASLLRSLLSSSESRPNSVPNTPFPGSRFQTRNSSPSLPNGDPALAPTTSATPAIETTSPMFNDWAATFGGAFPEGDDFASGGGYSTFGGAEGGTWGSEPTMAGGEQLNLESIWPANVGIFDSHLLPGWNTSMSLAGGTVSFENGGSFTPQVGSPTHSHARRATGE